MMDLEEQQQRLRQPARLGDRAADHRRGYAQFGLVPAVTPTTDVPIQVDRVPQPAGDRPGFLRRTAERNGFVFYVEPVTFGVNKAYWGPENRLGLPQPALTQDMGAATNLSSLDFSHDSLTAGRPDGVVRRAVLQAEHPDPAAALAEDPAAGQHRPRPPCAAPSSATPPTRTRCRRRPSLVAAATNTGNAVSGDGEVDTVKYGHVLRARRLVGVRGAGLSYDGLYSVDSVTHKLTRGEYTQRFRISREGTGTTAPAVLP